MNDRKREESALRYSEENYRLVVETAPDAVISIDESGAILFANPATVRIFGYDPTELIGKPLTVLMPEFLRKLHEKGFSRYLATGQRHINWQGTELTALRRNGQEFPVEISFGELSRDGHKVFTGFIRDISERKQAEEMRAGHARQIAVRAEVSMAFGKEESLKTILGETGTGSGYSSNLSTSGPPYWRQHASKHAAATGHPIIASFEPGEDWFFDYETQGMVKGVELLPPHSHPRNQPAPGPAGRVPANWESFLN